MKQTGDQALVKQINKSIVLELIKSSSPLSRAKISQLSGLNKATVSSLVQEILDNELAEEIGAGPSSGGRKPVLLLFRKTAGYAIGVDLGVNYMLVVLTDLEGNIVIEEHTDIELPATGNIKVEGITKKLSELLRSVIDRCPPCPYGVVGIGIGVPGLAGPDGTVLFAPHLGWEHVNLKEIVEQEFSLPVTIENEANAGAVGEKRFGAGRDVNHLVYVSIGIGIGTGIMLGGELFRGAAGFSGEMGHMTIDTNGKRCRCGNRGCWELYASEQALIEQASLFNIHRHSIHQNNQTLQPPSNANQSHEISNQSFAAPSQSQPDLQQLLVWAKEKQPEVLQLLKQTGEYLGVGIVNIVNTFNPELVVIGNRFSPASEWLLGPIRDIVEQRCLPYHRKPLAIEFSSLNTHAAVLGASYMAVDRFFIERRTQR